MEERHVQFDVIRSGLTYCGIVVCGSLKHVIGDEAGPLVDAEVGERVPDVDDGPNLVVWAGVEDGIEEARRVVGGGAVLIGLVG